MNDHPTYELIAGLRAERGDSLAAFATAIGCSSKGRISEMEHGLATPTVAQALAIERLSDGRIDAARLNADVAAARAAFGQRTHDGTSAVDDDAPAPEGCMSGPERTWELTDDELASLPDADPDLRVVICAVCEQRLDERHVRACQAQDCPHAQREAA